MPHADSKLNPDSLNNSPYLRACFKEATRLSPIILGGLRATGQDIVLQGYQVPKDVSIHNPNLASLYSTHFIPILQVDIAMVTNFLQRSEEHFPQPNEFIPERWLKVADATVQCPSARTAHPYINSTFGFGPRSCIGRRFAEMEIEVLLARILRKYTLEWMYGPIQYKTTFIQVPIDDLKFKLTELNE